MPRVSEQLHVDEPLRLLAFLRRALPGWKRSTLEQRIRAGCVLVNGSVQVRNDFVAVGDEVVVVDLAEAVDATPLPAGIAILLEDDELVAIDKPAGLLAVATSDERERTALALLRTYLARAEPGARLFPVHRIDRETSGVLLFAKTREARDALQASWSEARKSYLAVVEGRPSPPSGVVDQPLFEDRALFVRVGHKPQSKEAVTHYSTVATGPRRALLDVELDTGRRHQIRAHLAWLGHPVVGDPRYGTRDARLFLHATRLAVPRGDGSLVRIESPAPRSFRAALGDDTTNS